MPETESVETGLLVGFEGYITATGDDYDRVLTSGIIVTDTNVLLNLYRYSSQARRDLLEVLEKLGERLWIPNQVAVEFWRNRETAAADFESAAKSVANELHSNKEAAVKALRTWANRVSLQANILSRIEGRLRGGFEEAVSEIDKFVENEPRDPVNNTHQDSILSSLVKIFDGKVGRQLVPVDHSAMVELSRKRAESRTPPGYLDGAKNVDRSAGDFLVWEESIREVERRKCSLLLVTGDVKEDWWRIDRGKTLGPRIELAQELFARTGQRLLMARPESLLLHAARALRVRVTDGSVSDIEKVEMALRLRDLQELRRVKEKIEIAKDSLTIFQAPKGRMFYVLDDFRVHLEKQGFSTSVRADFWDLRADRPDGVSLAVTLLTFDDEQSTVAFQIQAALDAINHRLDMPSDDASVTPFILTVLRPSIHLQKTLDHSNIGLAWPERNTWCGNVTAQGFGIALG